MKTIKKMENDTFLEGMVAVSENNKTKNSLATASQIIAIRQICLFSN